MRTLDKNNSVYAIVVTYNRRQLLERCITALKNQTRALQKILLIDNASTDDTQTWIKNYLLKNDARSINYIRLHDNLGGAGGFAEGMSHAINMGANWIWMMDDDAEPHLDALEQLLAIVETPNNIYGSLAVNGNEPSWTTTLLEPEPRVVNDTYSVPTYARVQSLPFLGFLIHCDLINRIGLPDPKFFITADDVEYCMRAEHAGAEIIIAGNSYIKHPKTERYVRRLPGRNMICLCLPPWKRYYDTRNRLLIARNYYGGRMFTQTIPGTFIRLLATLLNEPSKCAQSWAYFAGFIDGIMGKTGRRHLKWRIAP